MAKSPHDYTREEREYGLAFLEALEGRPDKFAKAAALSGISKAALIFWAAEEATPAAPVIEVAGKRPLPSEDLSNRNCPVDLCSPANDVWEWMRQTFILPGSPLYNPQHWHLRTALVGVVWTNVEKSVNGVRRVGEASLPKVQGGKWVQVRVETQYREWFGRVPEYLITLDSLWCSRATDRQFCHVCDHELLHCAIKYNQMGEPLTTDEGQPIGCLKGHDVEEFNLMVELYGAIGGGDSAGLVRAASRRPKWTDADIAAACGPASD